MVKIQMTWNKYDQAIDKIAKHFTSMKFDVIIGLTRGGLIPAICLSHKLDTPMLPFNPHLLHANGEERGNIKLPISPAIVRRILIIDEISDTGKTLSKCTKFFEKKGFNISTAAVYTNKQTTIFKPNFSVFDSQKKWVVFPWEHDE